MMITTKMAVITAINGNPGWEIFLTKHLLPQMDAGRISIVDGSDESVDGALDGLSRQMRTILEKADGNDIDLGAIIATFSRHSHAVLIVFLSFPLCLPVGIPVISTALGLALGFVGFLYAIGRETWIPKSIAAKTIPYKGLAYIIERLLWASERMERWFQPRMLFFATNNRMIRVHGIFVMLLGFAAAVPLPLPFHNMVAAIPALLLGLSLIERDGALVMVSYLTSIPFLIYYGALVFFGYAGFQRLIGF
jgi:hypothetical protein